MIALLIAAALQSPDVFEPRDAFGIGNQRCERNGFNDGARSEQALRGIVGKRLTYGGPVTDA